jgi:hypothetical protein
MRIPPPQDQALTLREKAKEAMTAETRVWCAMIYVADSHDVAGAVRRSKRLHWKQDDARREVEAWVTEMALDPVAWQIVDDETLVSRLRGHFAVVSSLLLPKKKRR